MEVINPSFSPLCNQEVLDTLRNIKDTKKKYGLRNLATIVYETLQYLEESPCQYQTRETIADFFEEVKPYKLKKSECLLLVNDPPTSALHVQLLIEESEERFTEEQVNELLEICKRHFPGIPPDMN